MAEQGNTAKDKWDEAGSQLNGLGLKLKLHYQEKRESGEAERTAVQDALRKVGEAVEDAVGAIGAAAKDPAVKEDVKSAAGSLKDALSASFSEIQDDLGKRFAKKDDEATSPGPRPESPPPE